MNHVFIVHQFDCPAGGTGYCLYCDGGIAECEVCHLAEGALTSECPGEESYRLHGEAVYKGEEDFRAGKWQRGMVSPCSPAALAARCR